MVSNLVKLKICKTRKLVGVEYCSGKPQGAMVLLMWTSLREGKTLAGVGMRRSVVSTNGNKMGVMSMGGLGGIMVGSADEFLEDSKREQEVT